MRFLRNNAEPSQLGARVEPHQRSFDLICVYLWLFQTTSTPMLRAVPLTLRTAAATSKQFRSGIFSLAISSTCCSVILPTLVLFGSAEPLARFTARLMSTGTGGVLVMKVKDRSLKIVMTTGMISPS